MADRRASPPLQQPLGGEIILSADDFGASATVNAAVIQAHREGVLTSASLMVAGATAEEAVALAKENPSLAVGLHLVVVDGPTVLPPTQIPHLVGRSGRLPVGPVGPGVRYAFDRAARAELASEIEAQFERFAATGLPLSHVDGHLHMHFHPTVFQLMLPLAVRYGASGLRVPRDDFWTGMHYNWSHLGTKAVWAIAFWFLSRYGLKRIASSGLKITDHVYGLMQTGHMEEDYVVPLLQALDHRSAELYFHPDTRPRTEELGSNRGDLMTLLSPAVARVIRERGLRPITYRDLARVR